MAGSPSAAAMSSSDTLIRLIYRSRAARQPGDPDFAASLASILRQAWTQNPHHGITGALLFDGAFFLQVIEGLPGEVHALYKAIARDMRHEAIELIDVLQTEAREHASFAMAFLDVSDGRFPELREVMSCAVRGFTPSLNALVAEALAAATPGSAN